MRRAAPRRARGRSSGPSPGWDRWSCRRSRRLSGPAPWRATVARRRVLDTGIAPTGRWPMRPVAPGVAVERPRHRRRLYTWIVGGAGLALLAAALGTGLGSHAKYEDLASRCGPAGDGCPRDFGAERELGRALQQATWGFAATG